MKENIMSNIMLIDSSQPEQTRVVTLDKGHLTEFEIEAQSNKQTIGNIYLAKVTRVEPSLQAAFVEYGAGRQGFLPFSEIHFDYYQIPLEDRQKLLEEENMIAQEEDDDENIDSFSHEESSNGDISGDDIESLLPVKHDVYGPLPLEFVQTEPLLEDDEENNDIIEEIVADPKDKKSRNKNNSNNTSKKFSKLRQYYRKYKIQEVIKKRQILLVQVTKGERGNKGASLTTYISLAGRYCVLMPNTAHGGGISRKITNVTERQNLKSIISEFEIQKGMGLIVRTAGANKNKKELKKDFEYLTRLWDTIREDTLNSVAPSLIHEEASLIKRFIRDSYSRNISKVLIQGEQGYQKAREYVKMVAPSSLRNIKQYKDIVPIFTKYKVEKQIEEIHGTIVQLKSGGYLVINQTEALVAIDINSGRTTGSYSIEETALKTNLEATEEIVRQLSLRDLAGIIVIDFIDMIEHRHVRSVEKKMKEAIKKDRARIQLTRISIFGLMEMTRQRVRPSMQDIVSQVCPHCDGTGRIISVEIQFLSVFRKIFDLVEAHKPSSLLVRVHPDVAHYMLNQKRSLIAHFEQEYGMFIYIEASSESLMKECDIKMNVKEYNNMPFNLHIEDAHKNVTSNKKVDNKKFSEEKNDPLDDNAVVVEEEDSTQEKSSTKGRKERKDRKERRNSKRKRHAPKIMPEKPEIYKTESGIEVVIENNVSVQKTSEDIDAIQDISTEDDINVEQHVKAESKESGSSNIDVIAEKLPIEEMPITSDIPASVSLEDKEDSASDDNLSVEQKDDIIFDNKTNIPEEVTPELISQVDNSETPKSARKGWWKNRFGLKK